MFMDLIRVGGKFTMSETDESKGFSRKIPARRGCRSRRVGVVRKAVELPGISPFFGKGSPSFVHRPIPVLMQQDGSGAQNREIAERDGGGAQGLGTTRIALGHGRHPGLFLGKLVQNRFSLFSLPGRRATHGKALA